MKLGALLMVLWTSHAATQSVRLSEVLRLGESDPTVVESPYSFYGLSDFLTNTRGELVVLESGHGRVQVFDSNGHYLRTLGFGIGRSPGRFLRPSQLFWFGRDTLGVVDPPSNTITLFGAASGGATRIALSRDFRNPRAVVMLDSSQLVVGAFSYRDSTRVQLLNRSFLTRWGRVKWPPSRALVLAHQYGSPIVRLLNGRIVVVETNPGRILILGNQSVDTLDLSDMVPAVDSLALAEGPDGRVVVRSTRAAVITGIVGLGADRFLVSASRQDSIGSVLLVIRYPGGIEEVLELPDETAILGCAGHQRVAVRQVVSVEYLVLYEVSGPGLECRSLRPAADPSR